MLTEPLSGSVSTPARIISVISIPSFPIEAAKERSGAVGRCLILTIWNESVTTESLWPEKENEPSISPESVHGLISSEGVGSANDLNDAIPWIVSP